LKEKIKESKKLRKETDDRKKKLDELEELTQKKEEYVKKLQEFQKNDPKRYQEILSDLKILVSLNDMVRILLKLSIRII
jgi:hypothetical protein